MERLYQKVKMDDFEEIKKELFKLVPGTALVELDNPTSWIPSTAYVLESCPTLKKFCLENTKKPISQIKFYASPSGNATGPHTDGVEIRQPFGLVIPVVNTENTFFNWYQEDPDNFQVRDLTVDLLPNSFKSVLRQVMVPIDIDKLKLLDAVEITTPMFARSDVMHSVTNTTGKTRIVAIIRWGFFSKLEDILHSTDILID